jgi:GNAT superfamily N-acetyltransferase
VIVSREIEAGDRDAVEALLGATGFFNAEELAVAMELVDARLDEGPESHYRFLVAREHGVAIGYACWGVILGTAAAVDLYWIAVHPQWQGKGVGKALLHTAESWIAATGRSRVYIETSGRPQYEPTRAFYLANGYAVATVLEDFYGPGDGKFVFVRVLGAAS